MNDFDIGVVGNGIAAMVAASELANGGNNVILWNPTPQWGAHFAGLDLAGQSFDIGMNLLEFTSYATQSDNIETYVAEIRNDVARFTTVIRDYIGGMLEFTRAETPQVVLGGAFAPDIVIANRLDLLNTFSPDQQRQIAAELTGCLAAFDKDSAWHARNKIRHMEQFAAASYRAVSCANHGPTLHDLLIEPICRRILGMNSENVSALLHRGGWMPLYYPETLLQQLRGSSPRLPATDFFYPRAGNFSAIVAALEQRIKRTPNLEIQREKLAQLERNGTGWLVNGTQGIGRLIWAQRPGQLVGLLGGEDDIAAYQRISVHIAFALIEVSTFAHRFSTLFVLDSDSPIYRITDQTRSAGQDLPWAACTIEISSARAATWALDDLSGLSREIGAQLKNLGVLYNVDGFKMQAVRHFKDAIMAPTTANRGQTHDVLRQLKATDAPIELVGGSAPFGAASFNDFVAQGLRLGRLYLKN